MRQIECNNRLFDHIIDYATSKMDIFYFKMLPIHYRLFQLILGVTKCNVPDFGLRYYF